MTSNTSGSFSKVGENSPQEWICVLDSLLADFQPPLSSVERAASSAAFLRLDFLPPLKVLIPLQVSPAEGLFPENEGIDTKHNSKCRLSSPKSHS